MKLYRPTNAPAYRWLVKKSFAARRRFGTLIPDTISARARASLGLVPLRWIDLGPLQLIREAAIQQLRDANFLEHELLPALGFSSDAIEVYPARLRAYSGTGLHHWQYPNQFSKYLVHLSQLEISSYLEIGVQHGGTFAITVEYLQRFRALRAAYAVDVNRIPSLRSYERENPIVHVIREDSSSAPFRRFVAEHAPFDLVLIDGDHSEEGCQRDFDAVADHASHIALHDIVDTYWSGVGKVWNRIKHEQRARFDCAEFVEQYPEVESALSRSLLGIGLASRKR